MKLLTYLIFICLFFSSCSTRQASIYKTSTSETKYSESGEYPSEIEATQINSSTVEIIWRAQDTSKQTDSYILNYGETPEALLNRVIIPLESLETIANPLSGKIYKYTLHLDQEIPEIYISLQIKNATSISPESEILKASKKWEDSQ
jgi:hypothetical protein